MEYNAITSGVLEEQFVDMMMKSSLVSELEDHALMDSELIHAALEKAFHREVKKLREHLYFCGFSQLDVDEMNFYIDGDALDDEGAIVSSPIVPEGAVRIDWTISPDYAIYSWGGGAEKRNMMKALCDTINEGGEEETMMACTILEMIRKQDPKSILVYHSEDETWVKNITYYCQNSVSAHAIIVGLQKMSLIARPELKPNPCKHCKIQLGDDELGTNPFRRKDGNAYCKGCYDTGKYRHYQKAKSESDSDSDSDSDEE
jgi:hypothetical protein